MVFFVFFFGCRLRSLSTLTRGRARLDIRDADFRILVPLPPLPLPRFRFRFHQKCSYFISSYPTHEFGSGWQNQPLPKRREKDPPHYKSYTALWSPYPQAQSRPRERSAQLDSFWRKSDLCSLIVRSINWYFFERKRPTMHPRLHTLHHWMLLMIQNEKKKLSIF